MIVLQEQDKSESSEDDKFPDPTIAKGTTSVPGYTCTKTSVDEKIFDGFQVMLWKENTDGQTRQDSDSPHYMTGGQKLIEGNT